jgi:hypothetical protein
VGSLKIKKLKEDHRGLGRALLQRGPDRQLKTLIGLTKNTHGEQIKYEKYNC